MTSPNRVTDVLRQDILTGSLAPGERLVEFELAEWYGCGRASVSSALVALE